MYGSDFQTSGLYHRVIVFVITKKFLVRIDLINIYTGTFMGS